MKLLIAIVNYRTADLTIDCLRSLEGEVGDDARTKLVVADAASGDDSVQKLTQAIATMRFEGGCELLPLARNGGFAYANNAIIRHAVKAHDPHLPFRATPQDDSDSWHARYVLLLNPDTIVRPGATRALVQFMDNQPEVGIAGSRLEDPDVTPQISAFRFHTLTSEFERGIRLGIVTKLLSSSVVAPPVPQHACPTDWVAGASMIVRREVFDAIGLLDEKYFMYFEEVDFCLAAKKAGWPCWYVPESRVVHLVGAASQLSDGRKHLRRRPSYWFDSRRRYFVKNHGLIYTAFADAAFAVGFALWRVRRMIQRKPDNDPPKMLGDFLRHSVFVKGAAI
jgi:N-acetylglucosaminyl-diphospho-decaprenol L-rhamnosyltransferase